MNAHLRSPGGSEHGMEPRLKEAESTIDRLSQEIERLRRENTILRFAAKSATARELFQREERSRERKGLLAVIARLESEALERPA